MTRSLLIIALITTVGACNFVQVNESGAMVTQANAPDVNHCTYIGQIDSQTRAKVLLERGSEKVQQELIDLARNQAASMGANAVVAIGVPENGTQKFRAYRCD
ncbi:MAG: DUF4156 domain-containing protein [Pseudomonadales bacterium]|nr:DUF4156 domain-containing protein [Pseudomonadales bacterium]